MDMAAAIKAFLAADVGGSVTCFRTDNVAEFVNEIFAGLCSGKKSSTMSTRGSTVRSATAW